MELDEVTPFESLDAPLQIVQTAVVTALRSYVSAATAKNTLSLDVSEWPSIEHEAESLHARIREYTRALRDEGWSLGRVTAQLMALLDSELPPKLQRLLFNATPVSWCISAYSESD